MKKAILTLVFAAGFAVMGYSQEAMNDCPGGDHDHQRCETIDQRNDICSPYIGPYRVACPGSMRTALLHGASYSDVMQDGDNNDATVSQEDRNIGIVRQYGDNGMVTITQKDGGDIVNLAIVKQLWGTGNMATITQTGDGQRADVTQRGNYNKANVLQAEYRNTADVDQRGRHNDSNLDQDECHNKANQRGICNISQQSQTNILNRECIKQVGEFNDATQTQLGGKLNRASISQGKSGFWNKSYGSVAVQYQDGNRNKAYIDQEKAFNTATQIQVGNRNYSEAQQNLSSLGWGNVIEQKQDGRGNEALATQEARLFLGVDNTIYQTQDGRANMSIAHQEGIANLADISQEGRRNYSLSLQDGYFNELTVQQVGNFEASYLSQAGTGNTAFVSQK